MYNRRRKESVSFRDLRLSAEEREGKGEDDNITFHSLRILFAQPSSLSRDSTLSHGGEEGNCSLFAYFFADLASFLPVCFLYPILAFSSFLSPFSFAAIPSSFHPGKRSRHRRRGEIKAQKPGGRGGGRGSGERGGDGGGVRGRGGREGRQFAFNPFRHQRKKRRERMDLPTQTPIKFLTYGSKMVIREVHIFFISTYYSSC